MALSIVYDKDPIWDVEKFDVVLLGTTINNLFMGGFQSKMSYKYPEIVVEGNKTNYADRNKLGTRLTINTTPIISLMYICGYPKVTHPCLDYDALKRCLLTANAEFKGKKVLTTVVGSSLFDGVGDKDKCYEIIKESTKDLDLTVYDYEQKRRGDEIKEQRKYLASLKYTDIEKYEQLKSVFDIYLKKLYLV